MSKYGTFPASSSPAQTPDGSSSTALDVTCRADVVPGSCAASRCRAWRELADPSALSVPEGFADAYHRARANLAHFADNYKLVFLVVLSASLLWPPSPFRVPIVLPCFFIVRAKAFPVNLALTLFLLVLVGATASVLVSLPVGLLLILIHAVLRLPMDSVDEEAGQGSAADLPSTDC